MAAFLMIRTARTKRPTTYAAFSVALGTTWLLGCIVSVAIGAARGIPGDIAPAAAALRSVAPLLAAGAGAQILLGALSYLMPVQLSKGPASSRAANAAMDRGGIFRVALANAALVLYVLPTPSTVSVIASAAYLGCMVAFVPLMVASIRAARRHAPRPLGEVLAAADGPGAPATRPAASPAEAGSGVGGTGATGRRSAPQLIAVLAIVVAGVAVDPASAGIGQAADDGVQPNGRVETVQVVAADMRFSPSVIEVEAGTELVVEVTNVDDAMVHDLVLATGDGTPRLAPGESATIDVGVVGTDIDGWCSIVGHRQQGMTLQIVATGAADQADAHAGHGDTGQAVDDGEAPATVEHGAEPSDDFEARDAELAPLPDQDGPVTHRVTWEITEEQIEIAPGVTQELWTFAGSVPGPVLHGRVGDRFEVTIVNHGTMGHSIDFHASQVAPDGPMRTIAVGESLTYEFTAQRSGIWMYHCSTAPVSAHIANGIWSPSTAASCSRRPSTTSAPRAEPWTSTPWRPATRARSPSTGTSTSTGSTRSRSRPGSACGSGCSTSGRAGRPRSTSSGSSSTRSGSRATTCSTTGGAAEPAGRRRSACSPRRADSSSSSSTRLGTTRS
jgi:nitrite reductase (NO-forming)